MSEKQILEPHVLEAFDQYFKQEEQPPSLKRFAAHDMNFFMENCNLVDTKGIWNKRFQRALDYYNIKNSTKEQPEWESILQLLLKDVMIKNSQGINATTTPIAPPSSSTPESSTSGSFSTKKLSALDKVKIRDIYEKIKKEGGMWILSTGTVVEERMEELALECVYEHPCHSLILDPSDKNWETYFTTEELAEIRSFKAPSIPPMPMNLELYLKSYFNKETLDAIQSHNETFSFHPLQHPDEHWIKQTITKALDLEYYQYLKKRTRSEADFLRRVWGFIDHCYDESDVIVSLGEKGSRSSSEDRNNGRSLATVAPIQRKEVGTKVDMLFTFCNFELGTAEASNSSDTSCTKTFQESGIKCPKTMKSMFNNILMRYPNSLRQLSTFGFVLSGLNINLLIMNSPSGHVCRISKLPQFLQYPTVPASLIRDLSLLIKLVWGTKKLMENVTDVITNASKAGSLDFTKPLTLPIPPLFIPTPTKKNQCIRSNNSNFASSKRRKLSDQTNSSETKP